MASKQNSGIHVLILGTDTFPVGLAGTQKLILLGRGLVESGCRVSVLNRWWTLRKSFGGEEISVHGTHQGVEYHFVCGVATRPSSWFYRKYLRLTGVAREAIAIYRIVRNERKCVFLVTSGQLGDMIWFWLISRILSVPVVLNYVESSEGLCLHSGFPRRMYARFVDRILFRFTDGVLPISEYLMSFAKKYAPGIAVLKVPVLVDRHRYDGLCRNPAERYLLFCGELGYYEIVQFIIEAFSGLRNQDKVFLYLVVNGPAGRFAQLNTLVGANPRKDLIRIFSKLSDRELSQLYLNAYALLIPLRPTLKDIARFPHKVGEYCASGRPVISTEIGEMKTYFSNWKNAVLAPRYDINDYTHAISELLRQPDLADEIGRNGKELAASEFDYSLYGVRIKDFLDKFWER